MQSQVHEIDPVTVELKVQLPWDRVRKGLETSFGKLQKTARVRGFRPGKVPRPVLQKLFGRLRPWPQFLVVEMTVADKPLRASEPHALLVTAADRVTPKRTERKAKWPRPLAVSGLHAVEDRAAGLPGGLDEPLPNGAAQGLRPFVEPGRRRTTRPVQH
ncbi:MAG: trigger factor family protein, partial [Sandaracinaceae bacterium]|nr:trigger factor family protein [Sandaracinaceae bacterium]